MILGPLSACHTQVILTNCLQTSTHKFIIHGYRQTTGTEREGEVGELSLEVPLLSRAQLEARRMALSCGSRGIYFLALGQLYVLSTLMLPSTVVGNRGYGLLKDDAGP